jgi:hypothetical protein
LNKDIILGNYDEGENFLFTLNGKDTEQKIKKYGDKSSHKILLTDIFRNVQLNSEFNTRNIIKEIFLKSLSYV